MFFTVRNAAVFNLVFSFFSLSGIKQDFQYEVQTVFAIEYVPQKMCN